jgi:hypothetical protein
VKKWSDTWDNLGGQNVKIMGQADLSRLIVRGRGATALTNLGWSKGPVVTILAKFENSQVEGSRYKAIGSLKGVEIPLRNLDGETKDGQVALGPEGSRNPPDKPRWRNQDWVATIDMSDRKLGQELMLQPLPSTSSSLRKASA